MFVATAVVVAHVLCMVPACAFLPYDACSVCVCGFVEHIIFHHSMNSVLAQHMAQLILYKGAGTNSSWALVHRANVVLSYSRTFLI